MDLTLSSAIGATQTEESGNGRRRHKHHHHHKHHHKQQHDKPIIIPSTIDQTLNTSSGNRDVVLDGTSKQVSIKVHEGHDDILEKFMDTSFSVPEVKTTAASKYCIDEAKSVLETNIQVDPVTSSGNNGDLSSEPSSGGFKSCFTDKCNVCLSYMKAESYLPMFLLLSMYGLFSAILLVVNHQAPKVVCANSFSRGVVEDARLCYPDLSIMACLEGQVLSLTGQCPDGSEGEVVCGGRYGTALNFYHEGLPGDILSNGCWSADSLSVSAYPYHYVIKSDPFLHDEQCAPPQFGSECACCNDDLCETGGQFLVPVDLPIALGSDVRYPHFGPGCTSNIIDSTFMTPGTSSQASFTQCHAYCSDGNWVDTSEEANNRRWFANATYIFAWISIGLEALCFMVALFHGVFPMSDEDLPCKYFPCKPVTAPLISYYTLIALGSVHKRNYECADRIVLLLNGIESIISAVLSGIVVFRFDSLTQMMYQWQYLNFFISRLIAILSFFKEVYKANQEHFTRRRVDAAAQSREETQPNMESQTEAPNEQSSSTMTEGKSYKKSVFFFVLLLAVCATAVGLGLASSSPPTTPPPTTPPPTTLPPATLAPYNPPESACENTESALDPKDQTFFAKFDIDLSGGLSFTEYDAYINCLYEDGNALPPKEWCDSNGDEEIVFVEYKLCAEMTDIFMWSEDSEKFYEFDIDKSGGLSPEEFQNYYQGIMGEYFAFQLPDSYLDIYFDGNSTAELTYNEYVYHPYTTLNIVDMDRDGTLSKQEFLLAFQWAGLQTYVETPKSDAMYDAYFAEGDENADGKLSVEEWGKLLFFVARDEDSDGKFSRDELGAIFCNPGKYLAMFDYDGDTFLSYDEYLAMESYDWSNEEQTNDILLDEYNSYDYNKDGFLSRDELSDNMKCWVTSIPTTKATLDLYMTVGDRNGDGKIGYVEWNVLKMFYPIDNDPKDGFLSKQEWDWFVTLTGLDFDFGLFDTDNDDMISLEEWMVNAALAFGIDYNGII